MNEITITLSGPQGSGKAVVQNWLVALIATHPDMQSIARPSGKDNVDCVIKINGVDHLLKLKTRQTVNPTLVEKIG